MKLSSSSATSFSRSSDRSQIPRGLTVITPPLIVELVALVGDYTSPLGPTIGGDMQTGSNTLASLEAPF